MDLAVRGLRQPQRQTHVGIRLGVDDVKIPLPGAGLAIREDDASVGSP